MGLVSAFKGLKNVLAVNTLHLHILKVREWNKNPVEAIICIVLGRYEVPRLSLLQHDTSYTYDTLYCFLQSLQTKA